MLSLSIEDEDIHIKDIDKSQISKMIKWFDGSNIGKYKYAMGIDEPVTVDDLYEKYLEVLINAHEFFLGINMNDELIGFIKGRADYKNDGEVWIMSLLVDASYQNRGIGTRVLNAVMKEFKEKFGIREFYSCVINDNVGGKKFWQKNKFCECRATKDYFTMDNKNYDLIIMERNERGHTCSF